MVCPNKNSPEWKALVNKYGEVKAMDMFVLNNYEIPVISNKPQTGWDAVKGFFVGQGSTLQELNKNPELTLSIIADLKRAFPDVKINKDGIIREDGTFVPLKPGEKGMQVRNALHSMVAWANDAHLETPPHEYAHVYVDMYRNHPMVKQAIEKYGEERLVQRIGEYYAGRETSSGFIKWIQKFWNTLRKMAGQPNIKYEIFKAFEQNEVLTTNVSQGSDIINYQKTRTPKKRFKTALEENEVLKSLIYDSHYDKIDYQAMLEGVYTPETTFFTANNYLTAPETLTIGAYQDEVDEVKNRIRKSFADLLKIDKANSRHYKDVPQLDTKLLEEFQDLIFQSEIKYSRNGKGGKVSGRAIVHYAMHKINSTTKNNPFNWDAHFVAYSQSDKAYVMEEAKRLTEFLENVEKRKAFLKEAKESIILNDGRIISKQQAVEQAIKEIEAQSVKRQDFFYNKIKNPQLRKFFNLIVRLLNTYQGNARLQAKFLSGGEDTAIHKLMYEEFNVANHEKSRMLQRLDKIYSKEMMTKELLDGSSWYNKNKSIDDVKGKSFTFLDKDNEEIKTIKLTDGEILNIYMLSRQPEVLADLKRNGIKFNDNIDGRVLEDSRFDVVANLNDIQDYVENNPELSEIVNKFDKSYEVLHQEIAKAFKEDTGFDLPKIDNYFPVAYGTSLDTERRFKKNVDYLRQNYARMGSKEPLRISDAYSIVNSSIAQGTHYAAYNTKIRNGRIVLNELKKKYAEHKETENGKQVYAMIDALEGNMARLEDSSQLYSNEAEKQANQWFNKTMNNFSVAVLGMNIPVMFKQPISYLAAKEVIDVKYLREAGWGVGVIAGIKRKDILEQLKKSDMTKGETIFPLEWTTNKDNPVFQLIEKHSPILAERFKGAVDRELGETMMDSRINNDTVEIYGTKKIAQFLKRGDRNLMISKSKAMDGIKAFDTATVMSIWKAVELETQDQLKMTPQKDGDAYYEHVARRTEEIVNKTQPTFDLNNRSSAASDRNPIMRMITMFSSARSKMGMLIMEGAVDLMNNPTEENKKKYIKRLANIVVLSGASLAVIDILKQMTLGTGFDDPEEQIPAMFGAKMASTAFGNFFGAGTMADYIMSNLDDEPWRRQIQHPINALAEDFADVFIDTVKGDLDDAILGLGEAVAMYNGMPLYPYILPKNIVKRIND